MEGNSPAGEGTPAGEVTQKSTPAGEGTQEGVPKGEDTEVAVEETPETTGDKESEIQMRLDRMTKANERLIGLFDANPEIPQILSMLDKGATFAEALVHVIDPSELVPSEGDPDYAKWEKASKEREKQRQDRNQFLSDLDNNLQMSQKEVDAFISENQLSEEEGKKLLSTLDEVMEQVYSGKVNKNFLSMLRKASTFDNEVETARKQGEIKARNEKIEAVKAETKKGDGLPEIGKGGSEPLNPAPEQEPDAFSESIDYFNKKQVFN